MAASVAHNADQDADRRPRLRPRQVPAARLAARCQADHRPPANRARLRPRPPPLGRRTNLRPAAQPPPTSHPHRPQRGHPRRLPRPHLLPHLLATTRDSIEPADAEVLSARNSATIATSMLVTRSLRHRLGEKPDVGSVVRRQLVAGVSPPLHGCRQTANGTRSDHATSRQRLGRQFVRRGP